MARDIAGVIEPILQTAEVAHSAGRPTSDLSAYDLYLRADAMVNSSASRFPEALGLLMEAMERDPRHGPALSLAAVCCLRMVQNGQSADSKATSSRRRLRAAGPPGVPGRPSRTRQLCSRAHLFRRRYRRHDGASGPCTNAQSSYARGWYISSMLRGWAGRHHDIAIEHMNMSLRLNPRVAVGRPVCAVWVRASVQPPLR